MALFSSKAPNEPREVMEQQHIKVSSRKKEQVRSRHHADTFNVSYNGQISEPLTRAEKGKNASMSK